MNTTLKCAVSTLVIWSLVAFCSASYYPQCDSPVSTYCSRSDCNVFYVDPSGPVDGDGSSSKPFNTVDLALAKVKSRTLANKDVFPPTDFLEKNPTGTIVAGDVIALRSGSYPKISISNFYNELPITITGDVGATPVIDTLTLASSANWIIKCLNFTISNPTPGADIVYLTSGFLGPSYDNVFEKNTVYSYPDLEFFRGKPQQVLFNASSTGVNTRDTRSLIIRDNYIYQVKRGIVMMSPNTVIQRNVISYFIGDGFRILHNNSLIEFNIVENSMNVDNGADHRDGLQMFTNGNKFSLQDVTIRNNRFNAMADRNRPFAAGFQGIASFDVPVTNITIVNNLVLSQDNYHGVAMYKSKDCTIMSNTIIDPSTNKPLWIATDGAIGGNLIQNNIAHQLVKVNGTSVLVTNAIKSWTVTDLQSYFVDPDNFNFRLRANASSPFIGKGTATGAPEIDNDGNYRSGPYDIGCYAFTPVQNTPGSGLPGTPDAPNSNPNNNTPGFANTTPITSSANVLFSAVSFIMFIAYLL